MKNKLDWKNYRMTLSDYIDHIEEKWLNAWISTWRLNKTKIHINEMDISDKIKELDKKHYEQEKEKERFMASNKKKALELFVKYFDYLWD